MIKGYSVSKWFLFFVEEHDYSSVWLQSSKCLIWKALVNSCSMQNFLLALVMNFLVSPRNAVLRMRSSNLLHINWKFFTIFFLLYKAITLCCLNCVLLVTQNKFFKDTSMHWKDEYLNSALCRLLVLLSPSRNLYRTLAERSGSLVFSWTDD